MDSGLKRWVILQHLGDPNDPLGKHFDLLLEAEKNCRTWRLENLPRKDASPVKCTPLQPHSLEWLEVNEREVSGGRGIAKRFITGLYSGLLPSDEMNPVRVHLKGKEWEGILEIDQIFCRLTTN